MALKPGSKSSLRKRRWHAGSVVWVKMALAPGQYLVRSVALAIGSRRTIPSWKVAMGTVLTLVSRPPSRGDDARASWSSRPQRVPNRPPRKMLSVSSEVVNNNPSPRAFRSGPGRWKALCRKGRCAPQLSPGGPSALSVDQSSPGRRRALVWKGPLPLGRNRWCSFISCCARGSFGFGQPSRPGDSGICASSSKSVPI